MSAFVVTTYVPTYVYKHRTLKAAKAQALILMQATDRFHWVVRWNKRDAWLSRMVWPKA